MSGSMKILASLLMEFFPFVNAFVPAQVEDKAILEYANNEQINQVFARLWEKLLQGNQNSNPD
jgi:nitrogenase subunit NifH